VQPKKREITKKNVSVSVLFLYFESCLCKIFIYSILPYIKITFTRFYRIGWLSLQGAISDVVLIYLFRIFTLLVYEGEFTNLFLNCNRLCAGACSVLQHKISSMDCQILSAFIFPIHFLDVSDKYFTQLNRLDNLNLRPVFHQFHNEIT